MGRRVVTVITDLEGKELWRSHWFDDATARSVVLAQDHPLIAGKEHLVGTGETIEEAIAAALSSRPKEATNGNEG